MEKKTFTSGFWGEKKEIEDSYLDLKKWQLEIEDQMHRKKIELEKQKLAHQRELDLHTERRT